MSKSRLKQDSEQSSPRSSPFSRLEQQASLLRQVGHKPPRVHVAGSSRSVISGVVNPSSWARSMRSSAGGNLKSVETKLQDHRAGFQRFETDHVGLSVGWRRHDPTKKAPSGAYPHPSCELLGSWGGGGGLSGSTAIRRKSDGLLSSLHGHANLPGCISSL